MIGNTDRVVSSKDTTVVIGGKGDKKEMQERIESLRQQKKEQDSEFEKEKLEERLARLSRGIGVIKVGAKTEIDMREKVERVKDAVGAATAAKEEGIVAGGGSTFLQMSKILKGKTEGERLLIEVLQAPARKLMLNSGENVNAINKYVDEILRHNYKDGWGYEVHDGIMGDLYKKGIIDPTKVIRLALENAIGVGTSILTTACLIGLVVEEKKP